MIRLLARIGAFTRWRARVLLETLAVSAQAAALAVRPGSWRAPVRAEFWRRLAQSLGGAMPATLVLGLILGLGVVLQAATWLGFAGQQQLLGSVIVTIMVRELVPLMVGMLLLGRSGLVGIVELGAMQRAGTTRALASQGVDPMLLLVMPMIVAFALAAFTMGMLFNLLAMFSGFITAGLLTGQAQSLGEALDAVLRAMRPVDYAIVPAKLLVVGGLVGAIAAVTAFDARRSEGPEGLLPRGFVHGVVAIVLASTALSLAA